MTRPTRMLTSVLVGAFLLSACGSSGSGRSTTTKTIGNSVPLSDPATVPAASIPVAACSLVSPAEITAILGSPATPTESDSQPQVKNCAWNTTPATTGIVPSTVYLGLIRIGNGQAGFGTTLSGFAAQVLPGVGDSATYSSGKSSAGLEERLLVTYKGSVSLSISALYGGTAVPPASLQNQFVVLAKAIFTKLHA